MVLAPVWVITYGHHGHHRGSGALEAQPGVGTLVQVILGLVFWQEEDEEKRLKN